MRRNTSALAVVEEGTIHLQQPLFAHFTPVKTHMAAARFNEIHIYEEFFKQSINEQLVSIMVRMSKSRKKAIEALLDCLVSPDS